MNANDGPYDLEASRDERPPHTTKGLRNAHRNHSLPSMGLKEWAHYLVSHGSRKDPLRDLARQWLKRKGLT